MPYNGDGQALTALLSHAIDVMPTTYGPAREYIRAGQMKVIGLMDKKPNAQLPGIQPATTYFPELAKQLPYSAFFGVFVKKDTPEDVVAKLSDAFNSAARQDNFRQMLDSKGYEYLGLSGQEAVKYLDRFRSVGSWTIYNAGGAKFSPEAFNIPKISE